MTALRSVLAVIAALAGCGRIDFGESTSAPTFEATTSTTVESASAVTWMHAATGSDRALFVFIATRQAFVAPPTVATVAFDGVAATRLTSLCPTCGMNGLNNFEMWYLLAPDEGEHAVVATLSAGAAGASGIATSYSGVTATQLDVTANNSATSELPSLGWSPSSDASWAVAAAMNQGGFLMMLAPAADQAARSDTVCDFDDWEGQADAEQVPIAGSVTFTWMIGAGAGSASCQTDAENRAWIAVGASFK